LILPHRGKLLVLDAEVKRPAGGVGHAILASRGPTRDMGDDALEAAIDLALRIPHGGRHLRQRLRKLALALPCRNEPEIFTHRLELLFQLRTLFRRKRLQAWRWDCALIHPCLLLRFRPYSPSVIQSHD